MRSDFEENTEREGNLIGRLAVKLILLSVGFLLLFVAATRSYSFGKSIFYQKPVEASPGTDVTLELTEGEDMEKLAGLLKENGVIREELAVVVQAKLYQITPEPGSYTVNTSMTPKEILMSIAEQSETIKESAKQPEEENVYGGGDEVGAEIDVEAESNVSEVSSDGN